MTTLESKLRALVAEWPCWHRWAKWKITGEGSFMVEYDTLTGRKLDPHEKYPQGSFIKQQRECEKCGKIQLRRARA